ncbi:TonB-dependent receptor [Novosphingobium gossypii]|uniref:TonB-dependent receptor n=1 Tax=Novosphingobium gossypii TaxID=1604774 RepID=UPI003D1E0384
MKFWNYLCATTMIAGAAGFALPAMAQSQPAQDVADAGGGDIIVTANKRAESVQDVPLAVSVVAPTKLQAAGVSGFQDLYKVAPSLRINPAQQPQSANISLRGVGTYAFGIGVEPSVAVLIDEVPLAFQARAFTDLPDVERLEVLRGPQSTLYGKAASAGLINLITRGPTDTLQMRVNGRVTSDDEVASSFSVSGPLTDTLGFIVSGSYSWWDGNVRNITLDKDVNSRKASSFRGKLKWEPSSDVAITLAANYNDGKTRSGMPFINLANGALFRGTPGYTAGVVLPGITVSPNNQQVVDNFDSGTDYRGYGGYLRGEFGLGDMTLTSITSYDRFKLHDYVDQDQTVAPVGGNNIEVGTFNSEMVTQELRLQSPAEDKFRYTVGVYFADTRFNRPFYRGPAFSLAQWYATAKQRQIAGFVQADWEPVQGLTLTGGARLQNEKVSYTFNDIYNGNGYWSGNASDTADTYKASIRYEFTPDVSMFGTFATGYKGQTYDLSTGFNAARAAAGAIKPETSKDWELGLRSQFLDRAVTLNVTLFNTTYKNLQAQSIETDGITQFFRLTNVGGLRTRGIETELFVRPVSDLSLSAAGTYLDAKYTEFEGAPCYIGQTAAQGCTGTPARQSLTGERLTSPTWNLQASADFTPALTDTLRGVAQVSWQYQSETHANDPAIQMDAFHIVNLGVGLRAEDKAWEVIAFVNNVFDQQYYATIINRANFFGNSPAANAILPRDFRRYGGVRFNLNF